MGAAAKGGQHSTRLIEQAKNSTIKAKYAMTTLSGGARAGRGEKGRVGEAAKGRPALPSGRGRRSGSPVFLSRALVFVSLPPPRRLNRKRLNRKMLRASPRSRTG